MRRPIVLLAALLATSFSLVACGKGNDPVAHAEGEQIYLTLGGLKYQVQISRQLNPTDAEDAAYLEGVSDPTPVTGTEAWFGVFMRVQNDTNRPLSATDGFEIHDTQGNVYKPIGIADTNPFRYAPARVEPGGGLLPAAGTPAFSGPTRGGLLLFRVKRESVENRPLELIITGAGGEATTPLDV
jgi:hypothetical protein